MLVGNAPGPEEAVVLPFAVYQDIVELCLRSGHNEVGWFGTMALIDGCVHIDEIFLPQQHVSPVTTDITGLQGVAEALISAGRFDDLGRLHFWGHCHPGNRAPYPSGMDEDTFARLCEECPSCLMGIFSQDGKKAYFRLHHHGFDVRLGWRVVWSPAGERFADFDSKVTPRPLITNFTRSPFRSHS